MDYYVIQANKFKLQMFYIICIYQKHIKHNFKNTKIYTYNIHQMDKDYHHHIIHLVILFYHHKNMFNIQLIPHYHNNLVHIYINSQNIFYDVFYYMLYNYFNLFHNKLNITYHIIYKYHQI